MATPRGAQSPLASRPPVAARDLAAGPERRSRTRPPESRAARPQHLGIVERQDTVADDLAGLVTLAGDQQHVARAQAAKAVRIGGRAVADLAAPGQPARTARTDRRRVLAARIVVGDDGEVGAARRRSRPSAAACRRSRSPPQPNTTTSRPAACGRSASSTFSSASACGRSRHRPAAPLGWWRDQLHPARAAPSSAARSGSRGVQIGAGAEHQAQRPPADCWPGTPPTSGVVDGTLPPGRPAQDQALPVGVGTLLDEPEQPRPRGRSRARAMPRARRERRPERANSATSALSTAVAPGGSSSSNSRALGREIGLDGAVIVEMVAASGW